MLEIVFFKLSLCVYHLVYHICNIGWIDCNLARRNHRIPLLRIVVDEIRHAWWLWFHTCIHCGIVTGHVLFGENEHAEYLACIYLVADVNLVINRGRRMVNWIRHVWGAAPLKSFRLWFRFEVHALIELYALIVLWLNLEVINNHPCLLWSNLSHGEINNEGQVSDRKNCFHWKLYSINQSERME